MSADNVAPFCTMDHIRIKFFFFFNGISVSISSTEIRKKIHTSQYDQKGKFSPIGTSTWEHSH